MNAKRQNLEAECLAVFDSVIEDLGYRIEDTQVYRGLGGENRFDPGFNLNGRQRFQYGDLRVELADRVVLVETESGGGLTNLVKYWAHAELEDKPLLLLHVFRQASRNDYIAHLRLWDFVWEKMRNDLWHHESTPLLARMFAYQAGETGSLEEAVAAFRVCLTQPLNEVRFSVFGFEGSLVRSEPGTEQTP